MSNTSCVSCGVARNKGRSCKYCGAYYPSSESPVLTLSSKYTVKRNDRTLSVSWKWRRPRHYFLMAFTIYWDFFLLFALFNTWMNGNLIPEPLIHFAIGFFLNQYALAKFFNRTTLEASPERLGILNHPIPWKKNSSIPTGDIRQLALTKKKSDAQQHTHHNIELALVTTSSERYTLCESYNENDYHEFQVIKLLIEEGIGIDSYWNGKSASKVATVELMDLAEGY